MPDLRSRVYLFLLFPWFGGICNAIFWFVLLLPVEAEKERKGMTYEKIMLAGRALPGSVHSRACIGG